MTMNNFQISNQLIQMIKSGGNAQQIAMGFLQSQPKTNPMINNMINAISTNNTQVIEQIGRNLCKERGVNPDEMIAQIKKQIR